MPPNLRLSNRDCGNGGVSDWNLKSGVLAAPQGKVQTRTRGHFPLQKRPPSRKYRESKSDTCRDRNVSGLRLRIGLKSKAQNRSHARLRILGKYFVRISCSMFEAICSSSSSFISRIEALSGVLPLSSPSQGMASAKAGTWETAANRITVASSWGIRRFIKVYE